MRLVDVDELVKVRPFQVVGGPARDYTEGFVDCAEEAREAIKNAPTISAVPVVRCQECKHLNVINDPKLYAHCPKTNTVFLPFDLDTREHFCSLGERKIETVLPKSDAKNESLEADHD